MNCFLIIAAVCAPQLSWALADARWRGNYKLPIQKLSDISKAKKHTLILSKDGDKLVLHKKRYESLQHVLTKAVLWSLYKDQYPNVTIESDVGDADYLPDASSMSVAGSPLFWGESGRMSVQKAKTLAERYPETHIVHIRWGLSLHSYVNNYIKAIQPIPRSQPFTFGAIVTKDVWHYFDDNGQIRIEKQDLEWLEIKLN
jgi:hypothetical protein